MAKHLLLTALLFTAASPAFAQGRFTRLEQDDRSVVYSGNWYANDGEAHSGGKAALTNTRGARVTVTFEGTGIRWIGVRDAWSGLANVSLDGSMSQIDTYTAEGAYQTVLFSATGLPRGPHTLSIEVLHERGPGTDGSWVWIDAFDIENGSGLPGGIQVGTGRVEENNPALVYYGLWFANQNPAHSGGTAVMSTDAGAGVSIGFNGTGIAWNAYRDEWSGVARVYIDDVEKATVDNYQSPMTRGVPFSVSGLPKGPHTLRIEVTGTRHASSKGGWIWLDSFDVTP
jgi:bacillopeptidase F